MMKYKLADDAKPQLKLLLIATLVTIALWFIPYAGLITYPIRLFVTFIHEAGHVLAAVLTGGAVQSLTIAADGSGVVYSVPSGFFGAILTSSAGYLGTTLFGVLMLGLIRLRIRPRYILLGTAAFIAVMTVGFGIVAPAVNIFSLQVGIGSLGFTVLAGTLITAGLAALAIYGNEKWQSFSVAFLAIQGLLNAASDLATLFVINSPFTGADIQNDAINMANATGLPSIVWVVIWMVISLVMISIGLRFYAVSRKSDHELPFQD